MERIKENQDVKVEDTKGIIIRKVKYEDIEQIVDINIKDWKKVYKGIIDDTILNNLNRTKKIEKWRKHYNIGNVIVAEENGTILGYCRYDENVYYENTEIDSEVIAIYVDCEKVSKGIGRKLLEYVMYDLKNKNKTKMIIWCLEKNENARKFYEKMGGKLVNDEKYFEKEGKRYKEVGYIYDIQKMEFIDIVNENNELTGQVEERWLAYKKGLWRRTVSCWIMNEKGEILLQKRTANKKRNPNKWAKTGGQVETKETVEEAIFREVKEELGVEIPKEQIKVVDIYKSNDENKRFAYNFIFVVNFKIDDYILQKEEVEEVKYVTIEDMELAKKKNDMNYTFCNWDDDDFYKEMRLLKNRRSEIS